MALGRTVEELENTLSQTELYEWYEYYKLEPFLADRLEHQLAKIGTSNLATAMGKIDVPDNYFIVSEIGQKEKKESKSNPKDLENQIKAIFGVKD